MKTIDCSNALASIRSSSKKSLAVKTTLALLCGVFACAASAPAATVTWTNKASGHWTNALNWTPNQIPGAADSVVLTSQTVTLDGPTNISSLSISGGTLAANAALTVTGAFNWTGGTISGSGPVTVAPGATLAMNGATLILNAGLLINQGTATWSTGLLKFYNGSILSNAPGAVFNLEFDATSQTFNAASIFANAGTFRKTAGTGVADLVCLFNNTGSAVCQSGALSLSGGGTSGGSFSAPDGTAIAFSGTHNLGSGSSLSGIGTFQFSSGTATFAGSYWVTNSQILVAGGTLNFNGSGTAAPTNLTVSSGTLGATTPLIARNSLNWTGGTISGSGPVTVAPGGTLAMNGATLILNAGLLINQGTATWSTGLLKFYNGSMLSNAPGAVFNLEFDATSQTFNAASIFANAGTFRKTAGTGVATFVCAFTNSGTLDVQSGTVSLNGAHGLRGGKVNFGIASPSVYGKLSLAGAAALAGRVSGNLIGLYWPAIGTSFNVVNYGSCTGVLTNAPMPAYLSWQTNYSATAFSLSITAHQTNLLATNLVILRSGVSQVEVAWPGDRTGWRLLMQTNSFQPSANAEWVEVPGSTLTNQIYPPVAANGSAFFRLASP